MHSDKGRERFYGKPPVAASAVATQRTRGVLARSTSMESWLAAKCNENLYLPSAGRFESIRYAVYVVIVKLSVGPGICGPACRNDVASRGGAR